MRLEYEIALAFLFSGLETFSRRDCGLILAGFRTLRSDQQLDRLLDRWRQQQLVQRQGRGQKARFSITDTGRKRLAVSDPRRDWGRPWDGKWRVFSFDLPATRRQDRTTLWRALRAAKFGYLQRSVWVWPHAVDALLMEIIQARGIPECFCGFEANRLFLCSTEEVVTTAWDFQEIARRHQSYLQHLVANTGSLTRARDLQELARVARVEREAYQYAFFLDPLLPRSLWPKVYRGPVVAERHEVFCAGLRRRLPEMQAL